MARIVASSLKGKSVVAKDGTVIGKVTDVQVDPSTWRVTAITVDMRRSVLERLHIDEPIIAGSRSLLLDPTHVSEIGAQIAVSDDVWDVGRMRFE